MDLIKNKRILIKLSGAALGNKDDALDYDAIDRVAQVLITLQKRGAQLAIVVGGGNIFRGRSCDDMDRNIADNMGMLATTINSLALQDSIVRQNGKSTVMSAIDMYQICETFTQRHADELLNAGQIVIFAGGTGCPFFSTDTAAALRAAQIKANMLLLAKDVDGVYDKDPKCNGDACKFDHLTYSELLSRGLHATDLTAITLCKECSLELIVFDLNDPVNIIRAVDGEKLGTRIHR